jgi:hypothetical protein
LSYRIQPSGPSSGTTRWGPHFAVGRMKVNYEVGVTENGLVVLTRIVGSARTSDTMIPELARDLGRKLISAAEGTEP